MSTATVSDPVQAVLARLQDVRRTPNGWDARCPAHEDDKPSLGIATGDDGRVLLRCRAGCRFNEIVAALGMKPAELFPPKTNDNGHHINGKANGNGRGKREFVCAYDYADADGELMCQTVRWNPKGFCQRRPDGGGGWTWNLDGVTPPLYRLPGLLNAREDRPDDFVFLCEGERDADRLAGLGLIATTNIMGAGNWQDRYADTLAGFSVVVLEDNDAAGASRSQAVARSLAGKAVSIRILKLPNLPAKGDVSDWLDAGGTAEKLVELATAATIYTGDSGGAPAEALEHAESEVKPDLRAEILRFPFTDTGNAERLMHHHGDRLKFVGLWKKWIAHVGTHWQADEESAVARQLAVQTMRRLRQDAAALTDDRALADETWKHAHKCESNSKLNAMLESAGKVAGAMIQPDQLDADPWLLNVRNGTINLRTGTLRPHRHEDFITKICPIDYDPAATCPAFLAFLDRIFANNGDLIRFVQRMVGYTLTGTTGERALFVLYGSGANGKSTLLGVMRNLLGDYASQVRAEVMMVKRNDAIPNDVARLKGARFVPALESDEGRRLAEAEIKRWTGGEDVLTGRFLYSELFDFKPEFKLYLATNHKPQINGTDDAIWDRVKLIPFGVVIPPEDRDTTLAARLKAEASGILVWAVRGCLDWQRDGLGVPAEVKDATASYRAEMDRLADFIADRCITGPGLSAGASDLYAAYNAWCEAGGDEAMNQTVFGRKMTERGFRPEKVGRLKVRAGIGIAAADPKDIATDPKPGEDF